MIFNKKIFCFLSLCSFLSGSIHSSSLPVLVGAPIRVTPVPGPTNPDPILQNLALVMDNHYQPPYYPGNYNDPDYLANIYYLTDYYVTTGLIFNPCNDQIMHLRIGQNLQLDFSGTFQYNTVGSSVFSTSYNGGTTWNYGPPAEQIIPLGGTTSQIINSSLGPGLFAEYAKNGRLDSSGWGFFDMIANPPNNVPLAGFLFTSSYNAGQTWEPIKTVLTTTEDYWFSGPVYNSGTGYREFYSQADPANPDLLHATTMVTAVNPNIRYANIYYSRSEDAGKNFSPFTLAYSMVNDPVWQSNHFDPAFISSPSYFTYGGFCLLSSRPLKYNKDILLQPTLRMYPKVGSPTYSNLPADTNYDQAMIRSLDNGKTWEKIAGATPQYVLNQPYGVTDPGFVDPIFGGSILEGQQVFGFLQSTSQSSVTTISPTTGRIYICYEALNPASSSNPNVTFQYLLMNSSNDQGESWTSAVQANRTPSNISLGAQQCFDQRMVATETGQICIAYYDFRNWTGFPGENLATTPLPVDAWLAIYDETIDPNGGSTGIGLDFVGEIRLTDQSNNARLPNNIPPPPFLYSSAFITATPEGILMNINENNELYVCYSVNNNSVFRSNVLINQYKGMTIDKNSYYSVLMKKFKFANPSTN